MAETLTPPPTFCLTGESAASESPRAREGFSILEEYPENLRRLQEAPIDELTGVPLLLYPREVRRADKHHPEHPESHVLLNDQLGLALRGSRVVITDYDLHHRLEHNTFRGPKLPRTNREKLERIIFNAAGMVPEQAIDFKGPGEYKLRQLPEDVRRKLWRRNMIIVERPYRVSEAVKKYLFEASIGFASKKDVGMLMSAEEPVELWTAAKRILSFTALISTQDMAPVFSEVQQAGLLAPRTESHQPLNRLVVSLAVGNRHSLRTSVAQELKDYLGAKVEGIPSKRAQAA